MSQQRLKQADTKTPLKLETAAFTLLREEKGKEEKGKETEKEKK